MQRAQTYLKILIADKNASEIFLVLKKSRCWLREALKDREHIIEIINEVQQVVNIGINKDEKEDHIISAISGYLNEKGLALNYFAPELKKEDEQSWWIFWKQWMPDDLTAATPTPEKFTAKNILPHEEKIVMSMFELVIKNYHKEVTFVSGANPIKEYFFGDAKIEVRGRSIYYDGAFGQCYGAIKADWSIEGPFYVHMPLNGPPQP